MAANTPARPAYGYERVPLLGDEKDSGAFRVFDPADNRIATCWLEENARTIVDALNTVAAVRSALTLIGGTINVTGPTFANTLGAEELMARGRREPVTKPVRFADLASVSVPDPGELLPRLERLSGEDAFRIFDRVKVLPTDYAATVTDWNLTDAASVRDMVRTCCKIALDTGKLGELAKAVDEHAARVGR